MRSLLTVLTTVALQMATAQVSPYTAKSLVPPDSLGNYRLLIGGHFHGASTSRSGYPASTVLAGLDAINATRANVFLSTGDLFMDPDRDSARYRHAFFSKLDLALFNAPGNHDLEGEAFDPSSNTPLLLTMGRDRILLLDTERDDSRVLSDQLGLIAELAKSSGSGAIDRVFIISHRPIWSEEDARYSALFAGNTRALAGSNYVSDVLPLLRRIAKQSQVFWISGSMAGRAPASIFFQPEETNITYIQCAVRDELRDALLVADVSSGAVEWSSISLTRMPLDPVDTYNAAWWEARMGVTEEFHWRRIPYLIRMNVTHPAFWYGVGSTALMLMVLWSLARRRKK